MENYFIEYDGIKTFGPFSKSIVEKCANALKLSDPDSKVELRSEHSDDVPPNDIDLLCRQIMSNS